mgnify:CR=1 FL=1
MDGLLDTGFADSGLLAEAAAGLGSGLASLLDELAYGLVITAPGAALLHANQAARHELGRFRALGLAGNTLRTRSAEDDKRLHDALAEMVRQHGAGLSPRELTAKALCESAGISRNALYRYHRDVLMALHEAQRRHRDRPDAAKRGSSPGMRQAPGLK